MPIMLVPLPTAGVQTCVGFLYRRCKILGIIMFLNKMTSGTDTLRATGQASCRAQRYE